MNFPKEVGEKYRSIPVQARASFWFLICGILQNGLGIITLPIFTRILSTEQYGLSSTYFAWNDLMVVICTLRLSYGVFDKGMIRYSHQRDKFESALLGLTTTISVIMTGIFLAFHKVLERLFGMPFGLCLSLFVVQIFAPSLLFWTARNKYEYRYQKFVLVTMLSSVICTTINLLSVILIDYDRGLVKIFSYQIVWLGVYILFYIIIFVHGKTFFDKEIWKYALTFNLPLIPYFLSTLILDKADRIMIADMCGQTSVAFYSVSYNLGRLMVLLTSAMDATFTPWIYQKISKGDFSNSKKISSVILILFSAVSLIFMLFAPELIRIIAPDEYAEAVYVIPPVIASYFFVMLYGIVSKVEFYYEKTRPIALMTVLAAFLDIVLNALAIPKFGYIAAGYTTLISYIVMGIGHMIVASKIAKKQGIYYKIFNWQFIIALAAIMIIITMIINVFYISTLIRYSVLLFILAIFLVKKDIVVNIINTIKEKEK